MRDRAGTNARASSERSLPARSFWASCALLELFLDRGRPRRRAAADGLVTYRFAAPRRAPAIPAIVEQPALGEPIAVRADADGGAEHRADPIANARGLACGERVSATPRIDPRLIQHFVGDPVADAGREALVEEDGLDRRLPRVQ